MPDVLSARRLSRRGHLAAGGAAARATLLAGCGVDDTAKPFADTGSGPWSCTGDRTGKVEAVTRPARVAASTAVAAAVIDFGLDTQLVGVFGEPNVTPWDAAPRFSYAGSAPLLENLATAIRAAKKVS